MLDIYAPLGSLPCDRNGYSLNVQAMISIIS